MSYDDILYEVDSHAAVITINREEEGEICHGGPGLMLGYWGDLELTAASIDAHGVSRSGDLGRLDADGHLRVTGRIKDLTHALMSTGQEDSKFGFRLGPEAAAAIQRLRRPGSPVELVGLHAHIGSPAT
jgi:AMP-binding enzyme/Pyridoxal-dependent decarboxylase, pyridoxal binding domain